MEHKFLRLFKDGKWTGNKDRTIIVKGEVHDLDEYAKDHGIDLPEGKKSKPKINTKEEKKDADLEQPLKTGDIEES